VIADVSAHTPAHSLRSHRTRPMLTPRQVEAAEVERTTKRTKQANVAGTRERFPNPGSCRGSVLVAGGARLLPVDTRLLSYLYGPRCRAAARPSSRSQDDVAADFEANRVFAPHRLCKDAARRAFAAFAFRSTCRVSRVRWVWSRLWSSRVVTPRKGSRQAQHGEACRGRCECYGPRMVGGPTRPAVTKGVSCTIILGQR
jgi:hypothetical protein